MNNIKKTFKLTDEEKIDIVKEYENNLDSNCSIIAKKYGLQRASVYGLLKRRGVKIRNNHFKL